MPLFGYRKRVNLNYYTTGVVSTGAGAAGGYVFSANGLYDPDITSTGNQPAGFDQMMVFFEHYTVVKSRIQVTFQNASTSNAIMFAIMVSPDASLITTAFGYERLIESGNLVSQMAAKDPAYGSNVKLTKSIHVGKFLGVRDLMSSDIVRGDAAANPIEQCYFQLYCWNPAGVGITSNLPFQVLIQYEAVFTERRETTVSLADTLAKLNFRPRLGAVERAERAALRDTVVIHPPEAKNSCPCKHGVWVAQSGSKRWADYDPSSEDEDDLNGSSSTDPLAEDLQLVAMQNRLEEQKFLHCLSGAE